MNLLAIACLILLSSASGLGAISSCTYQETHVDLSLDGSKHIHALDDHKSQFSCARSCKAETGCSGIGFRNSPGSENCILIKSGASATAKLPASSVGFKYYTMTRGDPSEYSKSSQITQMVIQRRIDGQMNFERPWQEYKDGFGDPAAGEFWLGNEKLHQLTKDGDYTLTIELVDDAGVTGTVEYSTFIVDNESENYKLTIGDFQGSSPPGDSMSHQSGMMFTTNDRDNDKFNLNCARRYRGAWWHRKCTKANLNGLYGATGFGMGINWNSWKGMTYSFPAVTMMLKRK